jgi:hypothetical protein
MIVCAWLIVSPFILGSTGAGMAVPIIIGLLVIGLAFLNIWRKTDQWPSMIISVLGLILILWGAFVARLAGTSGGANEIIVGLLLIVLGLLVLPFQVAVSKVQFYNRNGGELAVFTQIRMKNDDILAKSMLLGSMPETIYMRPEEICKAIALIDSKVILSLPVILYKGWKRNRTQKSNNL